MIINHRNILTLDSMGVTLDNIGAPTGSLPVIYVPDDGSVVFVPSSGIDRHSAWFDDCHHHPERECG